MSEVALKRALIGAFVLFAAWLSVVVAYAQTLPVSWYVYWQAPSNAVAYQVYTGAQGAEGLNQTVQTLATTVRLNPGQCVYVQPIDDTGAQATQPSQEVCPTAAPGVPNLVVL